MTAVVLRGNALALPLADNSVDLVVTSPPYFALRSYTDGGSHYEGQIGSEATPAAFVDALIAATREMVRVVKPSGSIWVNLGDKYSTGSSGDRNNGFNERSGNASGQRIQERSQVRSAAVAGMRPKSLIGVPWRYALRCIDELGLILRAEVIWSKSNGLPESVQDRVRRSHEQWFCFQQSGGIESQAQSFPFCPLCGRPVDARSTLIRRIKELDRSVEAVDLPNHVRPDDRVDSSDARRGNHDAAVGSGSSVVPVLEALNSEIGVDPADLVEDRIVPVVDADAKKRSTLAPYEGHGPLSIDDSAKPADVCECVGHPLIIDDEPWIPQSLAAEVMQLVADGECDPQQAADFLSGDYVRNHSVWFHFTLEPRYYSAVDEIREAQKEPDRRGPDSGSSRRVNGGANQGFGLAGNFVRELGKLPGSVWTIATEPLKVPSELGIDHFAAFPMEWPRRIIQGWSPSGVCTACGEGRRPVVTADYDNEGRTTNGPQSIERRFESIGFTARAVRTTTITGYTCGCPEPTAPTTPAVVLDPFGGTGTTALVAKALGRRGISVDMSADYCRLARWRTTDEGELARALQVKKPEKQIEGQVSMFDLLEDGGAA